jgi:hypothetical protein
VVVGVAAFALALLPPSKVGSAAGLVRYLAAGFLAGLGALLAARGALLGGAILTAAAALVLLRRRQRARARAGAEPARAGGPMTVEEAYAVLGLRPGATASEIKAAHHALMQKIHPDHGGTSYLAAKLNEARDLLLERIG